MKDLVEKVRTSFKSSALSAQCLLAKFKYLPPDVTNRTFFYDPKYYPFYFHLGRHVTAENVLDMSLAGGLPLSCFLLGKTGTENVLAFQRQSVDFYSPRMATHNVRAVYRRRLSAHVGAMDDVTFQKKLQSYDWNAVLMTERLPYDECLGYLRVIWSSVASGGIIILDYVNYDKSMGQAYHDFAKTSNRDTVIFDTKYGVGLICK